MTYHKLSKSAKVIVFVAVFAVATFSASNLALAAPLTEAMMRLDTMRLSQTDVRVLVVAKPATTATETGVNVMVNWRYPVDATATNITVSTTGIGSAGDLASIQGEAVVAWPGIATATAVNNTTCESTQTCHTITFPSNDLTAGTLYAFYITAGVDTPAAVTQYSSHTSSITTSGAGGAIDTAKVATALIETATTDNRVVITGVVPPTLYMELNRNTTTFVDDPDNDGVIGAGGPNAMDIDPTGIMTSQRVLVSVGTNALSGWVAWLRSETSPTVRLHSALTNENINSQGTDADVTCNDADTLISPGSDFYQLAVAVHTDSTTVDPDTLVDNTGTVSVAPKYNCDSTHGGKISSNFQQIAYSDGKTDEDIVSVYARASTSTMKAASTDYTDTWDIVASANF